MTADSDWLIKNHTRTRALHLDESAHTNILGPVKASSALAAAEAEAAAPSSWAVVRPKVVARAFARASRLHCLEETSQPVGGEFGEPPFYDRDMPM